MRRRWHAVALRSLGARAALRGRCRDAALRAYLDGAYDAALRRSCRSCATATDASSSARAARCRSRGRTGFAGTTASRTSSTIVADGRNLWLYDADLEQVTVRPLEHGAWRDTRDAALGAGKARGRFEVLRVDRDDGTGRGVGSPRSSRARTFESVSLAFDGKRELAAMELTDKLGQTHASRFHPALKRNRPLDEKLFRFAPPAGVGRDRRRRSP